MRAAKARNEARREARNEAWRRGSHINSEDDGDDCVESDNDYESCEPGGEDFDRPRAQIEGGTYLWDNNHVNLSDYRDELVVDIYGRLRANLPDLSRASRQFLAETIFFTFDSDYKFVFHVNSFDISSISTGVTRLLADVCGMEGSENNTMVVLRSVSSSKSEKNLRSWLRRYWNQSESFPLFNINLETLWRQGPSSTGLMQYGDGHTYPMMQVEAKKDQYSFGNLSGNTSEEMAQAFLEDDGWEKLEFNRTPWERGAMIPRYQSPQKTCPDLFK